MRPHFRHRRSGVDVGRNDGGHRPRPRDGRAGTSATSIARAAAKKMVVYHRRAGGQSQFSTLLQLEPKSDRIQSALSYARRNLKTALSVEQLAEVANLQTRGSSAARLHAPRPGSPPPRRRLRTSASKPHGFSWSRVSCQSMSSLAKPASPIASVCVAHSFAPSDSRRKPSPRARGSIERAETTHVPHTRHQQPCQPANVHSAPGLVRPAPHLHARQHEKRPRGSETYDVSGQPARTPGPVDAIDDK